MALNPDDLIARGVAVPDSLAPLGIDAMVVPVCSALFGLDSISCSSLALAVGKLPGLAGLNFGRFGRFVRLNGSYCRLQLLDLMAS